MDTRTKRRYKLAETILWKRGIKSRAQLVDLIDQRHGYDALDGIGPILSKLIEKSLTLSDAAWAALFPRLPLVGPEQPVDGMNVPGVWYPADAFTEGHSLTPPDSEGAGKGPSYDPD